MFLSPYLDLLSTVSADFTTVGSGFNIYGFATDFSSSSVVLNVLTSYFNSLTAVTISGSFLRVVTNYVTVGIKT